VKRVHHSIKKSRIHGKGEERKAGVKSLWVRKMGKTMLHVVTKESIIDQTCWLKISPDPSFSKRGNPPFCKGREGGISSLVSKQLWTE
jgi:hypothetical protein